MCELRTIGSPRAVQCETDRPHENTNSRCEVPVTHYPGDPPTRVRQRWRLADGTAAQVARLKKPQAMNMNAPRTGLSHRKTHEQLIEVHTSDK